MNRWERDGLVDDPAPGTLHGESVSIGMVKEAEVARGLGHLASAEVARLRQALKKNGLPVDLPANLSVKVGSLPETRLFFERYWSIFVILYSYLSTCFYLPTTIILSAIPISFDDCPHLHL